MQRLLLTREEYRKRRDEDYEIRKRGVVNVNESVELDQLKKRQPCEVARRGSGGGEHILQTEIQKMQ